MEKFTKILENKINEKYFEVYADIRLILKSNNEGEAGYKSDLILGSINEQADFTVTKIGELSKEEYKKYFEKIEYNLNKRSLEPINEGKSLNDSLIEDINLLVDRLEYLKKFIIDNIKEDDLDFFRKINTINTDIKLLSKKLKK